MPQDIPGHAGHMTASLDVSAASVIRDSLPHQEHGLLHFSYTQQGYIRVETGRRKGSRSPNPTKRWLPSNGSCWKIQLQKDKEYLSKTGVGKSILNPEPTRPKSSESGRIRTQRCLFLLRYYSLTCNSLKHDFSLDLRMNTEKRDSWQIKGFSQLPLDPLYRTTR